MSCNNRMTAVVLATLLAFGCAEKKPEQPKPDAFALSCFANAIQSSREGDVLLLEAEELPLAWENQRRVGTLPPGCWAVVPYRCEDGCTTRKEGER